MRLEINPDLLSQLATHIFDGNKVKVFMSTYNDNTNTVSGEIMSGEHKGKLTTVYLNQATEIKG